MLIVDAQIHLWNAGNPTSATHRHVPAYLKDDALKEMDAGEVAQPLLYSSWRRHQRPVSLRPLGARSSHWYMPQRPSTPRE